jgi:hypothetical protein
MPSSCESNRLFISVTAPIPSPWDRGFLVMLVSLRHGEQPDKPVARGGQGGSSGLLTSTDY